MRKLFIALVAVAMSLALASSASAAPVNTITTLTSPNPSQQGQAVTFTATVTSGGAPVKEGAITFREGTIALSGPIPLSASGQALFTIATLPTGARSISADYGGTAAFAPSGATLTQNVLGPRRTLHLTTTVRTSSASITGGGHQAAALILPLLEIAVLDKLGLEAVSSDATLGGDCNIACDISVPDGYTIVVRPRPGVEDHRLYAFSGACTGVLAECRVLMNSEKSLTATFQKLAKLKVLVQGAGTVVFGTAVSESPSCISSEVTLGSDPYTCTATYDSGASVSLRATANSGNRFVGWTQDCAGTAGCSLTMSADRNVTATFKRMFSVTIQPSTGSGAGTVAREPTPVRADGLTDCDAEPTNGCEVGSRVRFTATASPGSIFAGWTGASAGLCSSGTFAGADGSVSCTVTVSGAIELGARFLKLGTVTVVVETVGERPASAEQWTTILVAAGGAGGGFYYSLDVTDPYAPKVVWDLRIPDVTTVGQPGGPATADVTAKAPAGWRFAGWSDPGCGTSSKCVVANDGDRTIKATFVRQRTLGIEIAGPGTGSVTITLGSGAGSTDLVTECAPLKLRSSGEYTIDVNETTLPSWLTSCDHGAAFTLTAKPGAGWTGIIDEATGEQRDRLSFTLDADRTIHVRFIDITPPAITIIEPAQGSTFLLEQPVVVRTRITDAGSGVYCGGAWIGTCDIEHGTLQNLTPGEHPQYLDATDRAGNSAVAELRYQTIYRICPLYDDTKAHKAGSTAPIKIKLCNYLGEDRTEGTRRVHAVGLRKTSSDASYDVEDAGNANPDDNFRFDPSISALAFNLSTNGLTTGTYELAITVDEHPHIYRLLFQVR